jgi:beta-glucanase (GH16 family)
VHPFGDPLITDDFAAVRLPVDAREFHVYAAEWTPRHVAFFVDDRPVRVVPQSPAYPMQFMLDVYALPGPEGAPPPGPWPKELVVDWFRSYRPAG